ncbi:MAG: glycosyltransferase family 9 protein, partial [Phycisphaerae bacterium]
MIGSEPRSVLVVLPTWVGDFVMSTPTLRAIRRRFAGAHILFLMESNLRDLARGGDWMDECIEWPARNRRTPWHREYRALVRNLRLRRLDLAVVLPNSARSAIIPFLAKARRRIGYNREGRGFLLTDRVTVKNRRARRTVGGAPRNSYGKPGKSSDDAPGGEGETGSGPQPHQPARLPAAHASASVPAPPGRFTPLPLVEYYADLAEAVGCERPGDKLELFTTSDCEQSLEERFESWDSRGGDPLVVISPGAKYGAAKCWP